MISLKNHRIGDFVWTLILFFAPRIFNLPDIFEIRLTFALAGLLILASTLRFSTRFHMKADLASAVWLIIAPFLLSYKNILTPPQYAVHVLLGFLIILFVGETGYRHENGPAQTKVTLDLGL